MSEIQKILAELKNNLHFETRTRGYNDNVLVFEYLAIPTINEQLKNSFFYYNEANDFIHFTSLENLYSLFNSRFLRLYNLNNMDDKMEFDYGKKILNFPETKEPYKEQIFSLSMCNAKSILSNKTNEHLLWKLHGRDGNGIVIRFKFLNDLSRWKNFHLSEVFYDDKQLKKASHLLPIQKLHSLTKKHLLDARICCFIKHPIYKFENEIRLIFENRERNRTTLSKDGIVKFPIIYKDKFQSSKQIYYFQLPIWNFDKNEDSYVVPDMVDSKYEKPKILITEIEIGYRIPNSDFKNIKSKINEIDKEIKVKYTNLKKYY